MAVLNEIKWHEALPAGFDPYDERPDWEALRRFHVHNWARHVGGYIEALWGTLTPRQRAAIALDAEEQAGNEEWE